MGESRRRRFLLSGGDGALFTLRDMGCFACSLPRFSIPLLYENRKLCYLGLVVGKEVACEAFGDKRKGRERNPIWNRHNPLKSPVSDE
jgi:hypothetical protein